MSRLSLEELEGRCQKRDYRRVGNWMARRVSRPLALRITWVVQRWGVSAHAATCLAGLFALVAAICFGCGTVAGWLAGAVLLQVWYLLDHVDGQLARLYGATSLDGVQLDYLMHHVVNLLIPWGVGLGLAGRHFALAWLVLGLAWSLGLLLIGVINDARYKAFISRLKDVEGELLVVGGGGRSERAPALPRRPLRMAAHLIRKSCEIHVVMNALTALAAVQWILDDRSLLLGRVYLCSMAPLSLLLAGAITIRGLRRGDCEREFAAWYRVPEGCMLTFAARRWIVEPDEAE
jgi:hypothetical protein